MKYISQPYTPKYTKLLTLVHINENNLFRKRYKNEIYLFIL